jgi:3-oxoacyl-[acyl-carrier-protein] synthase II
MISSNRVVVTGMGVVSPCGIGLDAFWDSIINCKSGIGPITRFDSAGLRSQIAGEVREFNPHDYIDPKLKPERRMSRASQFAVAAARMAFEDASFDYKNASRIPVVMGVSTTAMDLRARPSRPWSAVAGVPHAVGSAMTYTLGFPAELTTVSDGCASGLDAIAMAARKIMQGQFDVALAGGADSSMERYSFECFDKSRKISIRNTEPQKASRPFDLERDGGVVSEGSGVVFLENLEHALARGAIPYAEIVGYGSAADSSCLEEGAGMQDAMEIALLNASLLPSDIDVISAHAPSDSHMDVIEVNAIKNIFGDYAYKMPVSSVKGVTGNALGAGCAHQFVAAALSMKYSFVIPTANLDRYDPLCDLDHVPWVGRRQSIEYCMIDTHGFGRGNSALIIKQYRPDDI